MRNNAIVIIGLVLSLLLIPCTVSARKGSAVPTGVQLSPNIPFLPEGRAETLDIWQPKDNQGEPRPAVVFIHGGGWMQGDKGDPRSRSIATDLVQAGYVCASINYKLSPPGAGSYFGALRNSFPQNVQDGKSAVRFLRKNAKAYGVNPDHIAVMGCSAGAHLAGVIAYAQPRDGLEPQDDHGNVSSAVQAFIGFYGVYDWTSFQKKNVHTKEDRTLAGQASPTTYVDKADPPAYLIHGTQDVHVHHRESQIMADVLQAANVEHQVIIVQGAPHSFDLRLKSHDVKSDVLTFLAKHLKKTRTP